MCELNHCLCSFLYFELWYLIFFFTLKLLTLVWPKAAPERNHKPKASWLDPNKLNMFQHLLWAIFLLPLAECNACFL